MRISDWSSDVCSSDLEHLEQLLDRVAEVRRQDHIRHATQRVVVGQRLGREDVQSGGDPPGGERIDQRLLVDDGAARRVDKTEERRVGKACVSKWSSRWSP